jgi:cytidylate kinase
MEKYVITISRQFASLGRSIAKRMAEELEIEFYDRDIVETTAKRMGQPISVISNEEENADALFFRRKYPLGMGVANIKDEIFNVQTNIIRDVASKESCIIVGRCANSVLKDHARCLNIFIYAPYEQRLKNCIDYLEMDPKYAKKMIHEVDKARENYRIHYSKGEKNIFDGYDLMIDSSRFGIEKTADILVNTAKNTFM